MSYTHKDFMRDRERKHKTITRRGLDRHYGTAKQDIELLRIELRPWSGYVKPRRPLGSAKTRIYCGANAEYSENKSCIIR